MGTASTDSLGILDSFARNNTNPIVTTPTLASGTAQQFYVDRDCVVYINITAGAGGTATVAIGPTSTPANALATTMAVAAGADTILTLKLPASWYVKVTLVTVTIGKTTVITD